MSCHCAVPECHNGDYKLIKWRAKKCDIHAPLRQQECPCEEPFKLRYFPGKVKDPERRKQWRILINRTNPKTNKLWSPGPKSRVCSQHFSESLPDYPSKSLGYDGVEDKLYRMFPEKFPKRRKLEYKPSEPSTPDEAETLPTDIDDDISFQIETTKERELQDKIDLLEKMNSQMASEFQAKVDTLEKNNSELAKKVKNLTRVIKSSNKIVRAQKLFLGKLCVLRKKCVCKKSMVDQLLTSDRKTKFYTGMENLESFCNLYNLCKPYLMNKWQGPKRTSVGGYKRNFKRKVTKLGRKPKLSLEDELLLTLMKLRLGLMEEDLALRFGTSTTHVSNTFTSWIKVLSLVLRNIVFVPNQGQLNFTRPQRFDKNRDVCQIIDCFECFIETPKALDLQKITWSEYKHHNTIKVLVGCSPNSSVTFISQSFPGSISDKGIVKHSEFLKSVPPYSAIMADKGFDIDRLCISHNVKLIIPPGKCGTHQMTKEKLDMTKSIAKLRILIEQVIKNMKDFKMLSHEIPITLLPLIDDIVMVCGALVNLEKPINGSF